MWRKNALFSLLLMFVKLVLLITFLVHFLTTFSTDSKSVWILRFLGHIITFFNLWSQTRKKRLKKSKNVFSKCVLDFNFAPIKGSVFFIFLKKSQIRCTLNCACRPKTQREGSGSQQNWFLSAWQPRTAIVDYLACTWSLCVPEKVEKKVRIVKRRLTWKLLTALWNKNVW